jgi:hypothetical protein
VLPPQERVRHSPKAAALEVLQLLQCDGAMPVTGLTQ